MRRVFEAQMKRSPMRRRLQATGPATARVPVRKCAVCRAAFTPLSITHKACSPPCAETVGKARAEKLAKRAEADDKRKTRAQLEAIKTIPQLKKEAQREFNRYIRARDRAAGHTCICCDRPLEFERIGGAVDAGHYRSTGSADHFRFDEDNCHAQRSDCNRYGAGRAVDYRIGLIRRIGSERVEALEAANITRKWTHDGLRHIRDSYRARAKDMEKTTA